MIQMFVSVMFVKFWTTSNSLLSNNNLKKLYMQSYDIKLYSN